ncbi:AT hook motif DNA-binding family protein [Striga asiatica]|uniref:AT-hook motif nuclear-localized protein n=1 Tax=Striga asiatica TaxID=4170 RepID=A0A5A7QSQ8_STRAF|nr:AT hook motif DNA-binding family protein [Striga asiatica]
MEEKDGLNGSGFRVKGDEAPQSYRVEQRVENPGVQFGGSTAPPPPVVPSPNAVVPARAPSTELKKKRGRPRKHSGDGSAAALSPMPISASIPFTSDYSSAWKNSASRPVDTFKKKHKLEFENPGQPVANPFTGSFIPHMLTVNTGEGRFEILSLTGSFMPSDNGLTKSRSGGISVCLAGPDGRVLGGGLAGMLVAAGPVQIVIGSFPLPGQQQQEQQRPRKPNYEQTISFTPVDANNPIFEHRYEAPSYNGPNPNLTKSASFNLVNINSSHSPKSTDREPSHEITC